MTKKIELTPPTHKRIEDTSRVQPRLDPAMLAVALGAEPTPLKIEVNLSPITLFAVREELFKRLHSGAVQSAPTETDRRSKISLADAEWEQLEKIAATLSSNGSTPTAGQVASMILSLAVRSMSSQITDQTTAKESNT